MKLNPNHRNLCRHKNIKINIKKTFWLKGQGGINKMDGGDKTLSNTANKKIIKSVSPSVVLVKR